MSNSLFPLSLFFTLIQQPVANLLVFLIMFVQDIKSCNICTYMHFCCFNAIHFSIWYSLVAQHCKIMLHIYVNDMCIYVYICMQMYVCGFLLL